MQIMIDSFQRFLYCDYYYYYVHNFFFFLAIQIIKCCRLYCIDWKLWRQSYKTLVLLEFLLTHGAEDFAIEFQCDTAILQELGTFVYIDEKG